MSAATFDLLARFGVRVIEVAHLGDDVVYVVDQRIALIDAGLGPDLRRQAADWLLEEVSRSLTAPEPA